MLTTASPTDSAAAIAAPQIPARHVASLDGLRAFAIGAVLLMHAGTPGTGMGVLGVDLFFVLSGFLITTLLVQEARRTGGVSWPRFWGRRFLRLMPAYWLYASFITILIFGLHRGWTSTQGGWTPGGLVASIWLYCVNFAPFGGIWEYQNLTLPLWSLAVEEQFYFAWPVLFSLCYRRGRIEPIAWGLVLATTLPYMVADIPYSAFRLHSRGSSILIGCAFALTAARSARLVGRFQAPTTRVAVLTGAILAFLVPTILVHTHHLNGDDDGRYLFPIFSLCMGPLVAMLWYGPRGRLSRALSWGPLVYLGRISYGMYLYHQVVRNLTWGLITGLDGWNRFAKFGLKLSVYLVFSVVVASVSYYALELPFLRLKSRLR